MPDLIKYDTLILTDEIHDLTVSEPNRIPLASVAKRQGALVTDVPTTGERSVQMKGTIHGTDYDITDPVAGANSRRDSIAAAMSEFNKRLYVTSSKFLKSYPVAFNWTYRRGSAGRVIDYALSFICPDPFFYIGEEAQTQTIELRSSDPAESGVAGSKIKNAEITNNGSAYAFVKVTVSNENALSSLTRCRVVNQSIEIEEGFPYKDWIYNNFVPPSNLLVVDSNLMTVVNQGVFWVDDLEHWVGTWLWLEPGVNVIQVAGTPDADYLFEWTERSW